MKYLVKINAPRPSPETMEEWLVVALTYAGIYSLQVGLYDRRMVGLYNS